MWLRPAAKKRGGAQKTYHPIAAKIVDAVRCSSKMRVRDTQPCPAACRPRKLICHIVHSASNGGAIAAKKHREARTSNNLHIRHPLAQRGNVAFTSGVVAARERSAIAAKKHSVPFASRGHGSNDLAETDKRTSLSNEAAEYCVVLYCLVSCLVWSCLVVPCLVLCVSVLVLSCIVLPCLVLSCLVLSCIVG